MDLSDAATPIGVPTDAAAVPSAAPLLDRFMQEAL
jgi:hypothetical protein